MPTEGHELDRKTEKRAPKEIESLLAIANGYLGTRASIAEGGRFSHPSTFAAGMYTMDSGLELGPRLRCASLATWKEKILLSSDRFCSC
jgi:trehalose/maltose hydrolase-like predicted phosphorylase